MSRILFIDNSTDHNVYRPIEHWEPLFDFPYDVYHAPCDNQVPELESYSHIIISGSFSSTLENKEWMLTEEEFIRNAAKKGRVILGSCFGHQLIAKAFFGEKSIKVREVPEIGWPNMKVIHDDILLGSCGDRINGFVLHFDEVRDLPEMDASIILSSPQCENHAFKLKDYPVWGIQPHFEIGIVQGFAAMELVKGSGVPDKNYIIDSAELMPKDSGHVARIIREFQIIKPQ